MRRTNPPLSFNTSSLRFARYLAWRAIHRFRSVRKSHDSALNTVSPVVAGDTVIELSANRGINAYKRAKMGTGKYPNAAA